MVGVASNIEINRPPRVFSVHQQDKKLEINFAWPNNIVLANIWDKQYDLHDRGYKSGTQSVDRFNPRSKQFQTP